jgi:radical SAM protein with 4Fe4S-binding SPASM domain
MNWSDSYLRLAPGMHLKMLEEPSLYDIEGDELYELSSQAFDFLSLCDGKSRASELEPESGFVEQCLAEGVLELSHTPRPRPIRIARNESPSLRYLMLEVTDRCNLRCRHCYLGDAGRDDLAWENAEKLLDDADALGLLRLIVTGGEPFLYPYFDRLNSALAGRSFRSIVISNGTRIEEADLCGLNFQEIQFSIDGLATGHDMLRGEGNFEKTMGTLKRALNAGLDISVATIIHAGNYGELEELGEDLSSLGVSSWTLEFPVACGRMTENPGLMPTPEKAAPYFDMEWGWGAHEGLAGYACGAHLGCVDTSGNLVKCGYYREVSGGNISAGLREAWKELPKMRLEGVCLECDALSDCGSGCRYRAESMAGKGGPDPVMCARCGKDMAKIPGLASPV